MARPIDELVGLLGFEYDPKGVEKFKTGIKDAGKLLAKFMVGVGAAVAGTAKLALDTARAGDEYNKFSQIVDLSVEKIQEYEFAARRQGLTNQDVRSGFLKLNKDIGMLKRGLGPLRQSLVNVDNTLLQNLVLAKDTETAYLQVIDAIDKAPDPIVKTAIATAVFGESGQQMVNMAKGGVPEIERLRKKFVDLGGGISTKAAKASSEMIDLWENLTTAGKNVKNLIGTELLPIVIALAQKVEAWIVANKELIKTKVINFVKSWVSILRSAINILRPILEALSMLISLVGGGANALKLLAVAIGIFIAFKLGAIVMVIVGAFKALTIQALLAHAAVLAIPVAIGLAVAAVVAGLIWVIKNWDKTVEGFKAGITAIAGFFKGLWEMILKGFEAVFNSKIFKFVSGIATKIGGLFKNKEVDININENVNRNVLESNKIKGSRAFVSTGGGVGSTTNNSRQLTQANEININTNNPEAAGAAVDQTLRRWTEGTTGSFLSPTF